ncbi:MAG: Inner membrane ABC transporter permease protein YcjP [Anaerolineales bacterium]|nr:Inner membrane ABC transporter permease protein YcjP [Anaerolineales bacterium]
MILPWAVPLVISGFIWAWVFNPAFGVFSDALLKTGLITEPLNIFGDPGLAMAGVSIYTIYLCYPLVVWMLKGFFDEFPHELLDAAAIDGCSRTGALFRIVLPVAAPAVMAVAVIAFMWTWNEFLAPFLFINTDDLKPLTVGIYYFVGDEFTYWNRMSAAGVITVIPSITFFVLAQRYIVKGLTSGALKH